MTHSVGIFLAVPEITALLPAAVFFEGERAPSGAMGVPGVCPGASTPVVLCSPCKSPPGGWCCASRSSKCWPKLGCTLGLPGGTSQPISLPWCPAPQASMQLGALQVISCAPCQVKPGLGLCLGSAFSVQGYAEHLRKLFSVPPNGR